MVRRTALAVLLLGSIVASPVGGAVVFQENWDSGAIDTVRWSLEGGAGTGGPFVYNLGGTGQGSPGDYALFVADTTWLYNKGVRSKQSFNRADLLRCTFKLFHDPVGLSWSGPGGPWSSRGSLGTGSYPALTQIEAGLSRHRPGPTYDDLMHYMEGMTAGNYIGNDGPGITGAFDTAYNNATTKATAVVVRVTLGATSGAKTEWSGNGGVTWTTEFDTREQTPGQTYGPGNYVSSSNPVWVVFFGAGDGTTNARAQVDDIVVEVLTGADAAITETGGSTAVSEEGATSDTYMLEIVGDPNQDVVVTADPDNQVELNGQGAGAAVALTFTPASAHTPQTITVKAIDDAVAEGVHPGIITHASASADPNYNNLTLASLTVQIADNDQKLVTIAASGGVTNVYEDGAADTYTAVLTGPPQGANAVVTADPDNQLTVNGGGQGAPAYLTFTPENWNVAQTLTVAAYNDAISEGPHTGAVSHAVAGGGYDGVAVASLTANITDDEHYCGEAGQVWLTTDVAGAGGTGALSGLLRQPARFRRPGVGMATVHESVQSGLHMAGGQQCVHDRGIAATGIYVYGRVSQRDGVASGGVRHRGLHHYPGRAGGHPCRWVWISPLWLALNSSYGNTLARYYVEGALAAGFHVAGIDVGTTCGSPAGAVVFEHFYQLMVDTYHLNPQARMLGVSNGGLITYGYAFRHPQHVDRIFGVYPAVDFSTWPGLEHIPPGPSAFPPAGLAYPLADQNELNNRMAEFNPIDNLLPLAQAGVPLYHLHGDADTVVPMPPNSQVAQQHYSTMGGTFTLVILPGLGHGGMEFFTNADALAFLLAD